VTPTATAVALLALAGPAEPSLAPDTPDVVVPAVHSLALMTVMRATETFLWPDPFARTEHFGAHYKEAFTKPPLFDTTKPAFQWDGDPWWINVVGHGLFGSELYLRARQCRFGWAGSLAFAAATSALWEYGFEANGVRPSGFDLVYTPLAGALLGEGRYVLYRLLPEKSPVRVVLDPLGSAERALGSGLC
jgi:hypothetical protein